METEMSKRYSIAEARHNLAAIVHEAERQSPVELTRRGEPVAVLLSVQEYQRLLSKKTRFWDAYTAFRESTELAKLDIEPSIFEGIRDSSPGREMDW
jgi:prevent-host-death family protein